jgi:hypothetical protein
MTESHESDTAQAHTNKDENLDYWTWRISVCHFLNPMAIVDFHSVYTYDKNFYDGVKIFTITWFFIFLCEGFTPKPSHVKEWL